MGFNCTEPIVTTTAVSSAVVGRRRSVEKASTMNVRKAVVVGKQWPAYTMQQIGQHNKDGDAWLAIDGKVYDVSNWLACHPGGKLPILGVAGKDCTDVFLVFHPPAVVQERLPRFQIGVVADYQRESIREDFHDMLTRLYRDGAFHTSAAYYTVKMAIQVLLFALAVFSLVHSKKFVDYIGASVILGVFWHQLAFVGHDFGHKSVITAPGITPFLQTVFTALYGVSVQWWNRTHNVHHVLTNSIEYDPDVQYLPIFAISEKMFSGFFSRYHGRPFVFDAVARAIVGVQHMLYYPVMLIARFNLYVQSLMLILDPRVHVPDRWLGIVGTALFFTWFSLLLSYIPDYTTMLAYLLVSHAVAGVTHVQITLSHFAMPAYHGSGYDEQAAFLKTQLLTSMDVDCPRYLDWFHGGLQFQVVHHILPRLPRHNLRMVRDKYLLPLLRKHNLTYQSYDFLAANQRVYGRLRDAARSARQLKPEDMHKLGELNYLTPFLNADG